MVCMMKRWKRGKHFALLCLCWMLLLPMGCQSRKAAAPSLCEALMEETQQLRQSVSTEEAYQICEEAAEGTVVRVEWLEADYLPIYVDFDTVDMYSYVPLEQWAVTHAVVTVRIDRVVSGTFFAEESMATFNIPVRFRELSHWDAEEPVYTGRSFGVPEGEACVPAPEDQVVLLQSGAMRSDRLVSEQLSFVLSGEERLPVGWLRRGENHREYWSDSENYRRNVIPPREAGQSIMEAAYLAPMRERQQLSGEAAEAESEFSVRGTVSAVTRWVEYDPIYLAVRAFDEPLEHWRVYGWHVTVTLDEVRKAEGESTLPEETELHLYLPTQLRKGETFLKLDGVIPEVGSSVEVYWNEGSQNTAVDWLVRCGDAACDILFALLDTTPGYATL